MRSLDPVIPHRLDLMDAIWIATFPPPKGNQSVSYEWGCGLAACRNISLTNRYKQTHGPTGLRAG